MSHRGKTKKTSTESGGDHLSALPDVLLEHTLGFLSARDAVRTCVLARRWRHLWRHTPRLHITHVEVFRCVEGLNEFVDRLVLLRDPDSALDEVVFDLRGFSGLDDARVDLWIRHALMCHARVLQVHLYANLRAHQGQLLVRLANQPLVSQHLARLELDGVILEESFLDFSSCLVLQDLKISNCVICADKISFQSLTHLSITGCELCWHWLPTHISAPSVISLQLDDYAGVTPILESMPLLETASVQLGHNYEACCDSCDKGGPEYCSCSMCLLYWDNGRKKDVSVLLGGLSNAKCLELKACFEMFTFKRDLRICPTFSKLKSLVLIDWCLVADLQTLLCFLQHTPVLEKLTLQLCEEPKSDAEMEGNDLMEEPLTLQQLKIVEVKCHVIDGWIHDVLKFLGSCSRSLQKINIQKL